MTTGVKELAENGRCRACQGETRTFLDLGFSPIANRLLTNPGDSAQTHPLGLSRCGLCGLVQNSTILSADELFGPEYPYLSSVSAAVVQNARDLARKVSCRLGDGDCILDVGSNDGTLQRAFRDIGLECLGVDPSAIPVGRARESGLTAYCRPFNAQTAEWLLKHHGRFSAVTMSNVLAHVCDPLAMLKAARSILTPATGLLVLEVQSWRRLVDLGAFDMVYHEHHSHFSLGSLVPLLARAGFSVVEVEETDMQGGSLRVWCRSEYGNSPMAAAMVELETSALVDDERRLLAALDRCRRSRSALIEASTGRNLAGYGAAAKTVTLLAAIGSDIGIRCIADRSPEKIGKFLPIAGIPIVSPGSLPDHEIEIVLIFAWNLVEEILPQLHGLEVWVPFPEFRRVQ